ncbi:NAD(P)/FAD-dependent oxidoreductase [Leptolyngbya sp. 'hensonii']|uniref:NAD(P)/FAD-dependent oxidoreductase n=1 Tax=Leptolyngbya sp. 'hensonii' TaxID=1922337 RepID=UPI0009FB6C3A|nr:NAD(P)/FAD-dependent oxidoreductase [Leptolyngbya sp. 'hensonii']
MALLQIVVAGGGAAGFFGAIAAAMAHPQAQVTLLEASRHPLAKVRISGGGRCNVTHACFDPALLVQHYPRGGKALRGPFSRFQPKDTVAWFAAHGVRLKTEADGRMFPVTDSSETIVDCLIQAAREANVEIYTTAPIVAVTKSGHQFQLQLRTGETLPADRLLLATGSHPTGYQMARSLGHSLEPPVPSLFTFNVTDPRLEDLAGVSVPLVRLRLETPDGNRLEQQGPLLITHWGLSGPAVLRLSAWGARILHQARYRASLQINWVPEMTPEELRQVLVQTKGESPKRTIGAICPIPLPKRLWQRLTTMVGIAAETRWADLSNQGLRQLLQELTQGNYAVAGKGVFKEEFVTCGGVNLAEVNFKTMESRCQPGLYFAGEVLDVDGVTGGFNFQAAWTTAWIAGQAMGSS